MSISNHSGKKSPLTDLELQLELSDAEQRYEFWPHAIETFRFVVLRRESRAKRQRFYQQQAKLQKRALKLLEQTNHCVDFIGMFGSQSCAKVLFESPWKHRLKRCPDYVAAAREAWTLSDTAWPHRQKWLRFFAKYKEQVRNTWMNENERIVLKNLPKPFRIFRGYNRPYARLGLSWTSDRKVATSIPTGRGHGGFNPWILTALVNPEDVIAFLNGRNEQEIIIDPKRILKVVQDQSCAESDILYENRARLLSLLSARVLDEMDPR